MTTVTDKLEQFRLLCEDLSKENKGVFVEDISGHWYFADILFVGEKFLEIQCFSPKQKIGQKFQLRWSTIVRLEEFQENRK